MAITEEGNSDQNRARDGLRMQASDRLDELARAQFESEGGGAGNGVGWWELHETSKAAWRDEVMRRGLAGVMSGVEDHREEMRRNAAALFGAHDLAYPPVRMASSECREHVLAFNRRDGNLLYHVDDAGTVGVPGQGEPVGRWHMKDYDRFTYSCVRCGAVYTRDVGATDEDTEHPRFNELVAR